MVDNLVKEYVSQTKCLILLTISMKGIAFSLNLKLMPDDIENQSASRKARTFDQSGLRTIGNKFSHINANCRRSYQT